MSAATGPAARRGILRRIFRRGPWENTAAAIIGLGVVMLCQPVLLDVYTYSFLTILVGTILFVVVTKFPD